MPTTRFTFRLPPDLADEASAQARSAGISLNAWLTLGVRNWVAYKRREFQSAAARPIDHRHPVAPAHAVSGGSQRVAPAPVTVPKVGRNELCPCGSGLKYKRCHGRT